MEVSVEADNDQEVTKKTQAVIKVIKTIKMESATVTTVEEKIKITSTKATYEGKSAHVHVYTLILEPCCTCTCI